MNGDYPKRGEIHLADIVESLKELPWQDEEHAAMIVRAQGFSVREVQPVPERQDIYDQSRYSERAVPRQKVSIARELPDEPLPEERPVERPSTLLKSRLSLVQAEPPSIAAEEAFPWLEDRPVLYSSQQSADDLKALPRTSLFPDRVSRGLFSAALATRAAGAEIDLPRLIDDIVAARSLTRIPTKTMATLRNGCQLLLDFSDNTVPFWEDLKQLAKQLTAVVGKGSTQVFEFSSDPNSALRWTDNGSEVTWKAQSTSPVLVATDMGINGRGRRVRIDSGWRTFIDACRTTKTPLLILLPWSRKYWPENIGSHPILVHWNPNSSATMIKNKVGIGHEVPG